MVSEKNQNLIVKYFTKEASLSELDDLSKWIETPSNKEIFIDFLKTNHVIDYSLKKFNSSRLEKQFLKYIERKKKAHKMLRVRNVLKYVAMIFIFLSIGFFFRNMFQESMGKPLETETVVFDGKIKAGFSKAILTLEDGSNIDLEKGKTIHKKNLKSNGKELIYDAFQITNNEIFYNYLTVPRGGEFHVKLSDGTLVWLNSESKLKFPISFVEGETRSVELLYGEAYFDVSPSTNHNGAAFKVLNSSQEVEVLGTEFNIKAYKDETNIYTTLVNGKVTIKTATTKQILVPNQQSDLNLKNNSVSINAINATCETSWRKGFFSFKSRSLDQIAKVLSRWYDVDIVFATPELENVKFNGVLSKQDTIEEILNSILTTNSITAYEIKNKKIIIK